MPKAENMLQKINNPDFINKIKNSKNFEELYELCKEINPDITQKEVENEMKKLSQVDDEKLEKIAGGKMDFNKTKALAIAALLPFAATAAGGIVHAGNTSSHTAGEKSGDGSDFFADIEREEIELDRKEKEEMGVKMEPRYFEGDYNQEYKINDLKRVFKGTFDISKYKYFKNGINGIFRSGPWRMMALKKAEKDPRFKEYVDKIEKKYMEKGLLYTSFFCNKTDNKEYEAFVEECHEDWNKKHKGKVNSYEDAFKKALLILKQTSGDRDPFEKRRVEVLYNAHEKIYLVSTTENTNPLLRPTHDGNYFRYMLIYENGDVLAISRVYAGV